VDDLDQDEHQPRDDGSEAREAGQFGGGDDHGQLLR
jgi:hypothetical protein